MARKKIIAGNWKMNMTPSEAVKLVETLKPLVVNDEVDVVFCVPAIDIIPVVEAAKGTNIQVGAENMYFEEKGAYTGEIAPAMLVDAGVKYVVLGHSERREYFGETNEDVNKKMLKAFEHGITPIMCCGETLTQREQGVTMDFIRQQVKVGFQGVTADQAKTAVIAYEPIWAIGTGKTATTEQAQEVCADIRKCIAEIYDDATAAEIRIQYGGSVNTDSTAYKKLHLITVRESFSYLQSKDCFSLKPFLYVYSFRQAREHVPQCPRSRSGEWNTACLWYKFQHFYFSEVCPEVNG